MYVSGSFVYNKELIPNIKEYNYKANKIIIRGILRKSLYIIIKTNYNPLFL